MPLTELLPKAMVPLLGRPLIEYQLETLRMAGVSKVAICTGHQASAFKHLGLPLYHNKQYSRTNMVHSMMVARSFFEDSRDDILITYGDIVYEKNNLDQVISTKGELVVMVDDKWLKLWSLRHENPLADAETMKFDSAGYIKELGGIPASLCDIDSQYTGIIKIAKEKIADFISFYDCLRTGASDDNANFQNMYMTSFLQLLIDEGWKVMPAHVGGGWLEVDSIDDLRLYEDMSARGVLGELWQHH